ncbi:hypothetical protein GCM10027090_40380 [Sinomonas soli]
MLVGCKLRDRQWPLALQGTEHCHRSHGKPILGVSLSDQSPTEPRYTHAQLGCELRVKSF